MMPMEAKRRTEKNIAVSSLFIAAPISPESGFDHALYLFELAFKQPQSGTQTHVGHLVAIDVAVDGVKCAPTTFEE